MIVSKRLQKFEKKLKKKLKQPETIFKKRKDDIQRKMNKTSKQAAAELCQAQHNLGLLTGSLELCTSWGCLLSQLWLDLEARVNCSLETTDTVLGLDEIAE